MLEAIFQYIGLNFKMILSGLEPVKYNNFLHFDKIFDKLRSFSVMKILSTVSGWVFKLTFLCVLSCTSNLQLNTSNVSAYVKLTTQYTIFQGRVTRHIQKGRPGAWRTTMLPHTGVFLKHTTDGWQTNGKQFNKSLMSPEGHSGAA